MILLDAIRSLTEREAPTYSWVGVYAGLYLKKLVRQFQRKNLVDNVISLEDEPHITIKYGLYTKDSSDVEGIVEGMELESATCKLGLVKVIHNEEGEDVLVVSVLDCPEFSRLNKALSKLPHEDTYAVYKPHMTIAYMKAGAGDAFVGNKTFEGIEVSWDKVWFSTPEKKRTAIKLASKVEVPA